ncbi:polymeric immunoglobulin receptor-like [Rhinoraja longicauda]
MAVAQGEFTHQKRPGSRGTVALLVLVALGLTAGSRGIIGPNEVRGVLGQSVTMECWYGQKYRDDKKLWSKGDYYLSSDTVVSTDDPHRGRTSMTDNKTQGILSVTIDNLEKSDEGRYWCATVKFPVYERTSISLKVSEGSMGITGPNEVRGVLGQSVTVECRYVQKYRDDKKLWSKGDYYSLSSTVVSTDDPHRGRTSMTDNRTQQIISVTIDNLEKSDEGHYWCAIVKFAANEQTSISLKVSEGSMGITAPNEVRGVLGQSVTMECRYVQKHRDDKKLWSKGDYYRLSSTVVSTDDPHRGRTSMTDNRTEQIISVTIDNLEKSDEGRYWCSIVKFAANEKTSISLKVSEGSMGITGPNEVRGVLGQSVTMECRYGQEYRDDKKLWSKGDYYHLSSTVVSTDDPHRGRTSMTDNRTEQIISVTIDNLEKSDEGRYWCAIGKFPANEMTSISLKVSEGSQTRHPDTVTTTSATISARSSTTTTLTTLPQDAPTTKETSSPETPVSTPPNREAITSLWQVVLSIALTIVFLLFIAAIIGFVKKKDRKRKLPSGGGEGGWAVRHRPHGRDVMLNVRRVWAVLRWILFGALLLLSVSISCVTTFKSFDCAYIKRIVPAFGEGVEVVGKGMFEVVDRVPVKRADFTRMKRSFDEMLQSRQLESVAAPS